MFRHLCVPKCDKCREFFNKEHNHCFNINQSRAKRPHHEFYGANGEPRSCNAVQQVFSTEFNRKLLFSEVRLIGGLFQRAIASELSALGLIDELYREFLDTSTLRREYIWTLNLCFLVLRFHLKRRLGAEYPHRISIGGHSVGKIRLDIFGNNQLKSIDINDTPFYVLPRNKSRKRCRAQSFKV